MLQKQGLQALLENFHWTILNLLTFHICFIESWSRSNGDVGDIAFLLDVNFNFAFLQYFEKGHEERGEFLPVDGFVSVDVEQVEDVLDVIGGGLLSAHQVDEGLDYFGELTFGEAVVLVLVELVEYLLKQLRDVLLSELAAG